MAKAGNHGQIIPRNMELLNKLYWHDGKSLIEIGKLFGVTHKSVIAVFKSLDIPRRPAIHMRKFMCIDCGIVRPKTVPHRLTKNGTGTRCHECLKKYKRDHAKKSVNVGTKFRSKEEVRAKRKADLQRWYYLGPKNPNGEQQWIRKSKHLLRTSRVILKNPKARSSLIKEYERAQILPT